MPAVTVTGTSVAAIASIASSVLSSAASFAMFSGGCPPHCDPPGYTDRIKFRNEDLYIGPQDAGVTQRSYSLPKPDTGPLYPTSYTGTISAVEPNVFASWNASSIPGSSFTYNIVNGAYVGFSTFFLKPFIGNDIYNLDNSYASYRDRQIAFASTAATFIPGIQVVRSMSARSQFLKGLAQSDKTARWMRPWLVKTKGTSGLPSASSLTAINWRR